MENIISLLTFPDYFGKDDKTDKISIGCSKDVTIFGKYICPISRISERFVGEEPFDRVTKQYNDSMKKILPYFGVKLSEIPRKFSINGEIISATKVRQALEKHDFEKLKKYVPNSTLEYLKGNY